jgi:cyclophilin family peptidyl-prolyl cis-trans isomerase
MKNLSFFLLALVLSMSACKKGSQTANNEKPKQTMEEKLPPIKGKDQVVTIHTPFGDMEAILFEETPKHRENLLKLAEEGFFDSTTFHRIIPNFMIQGGDPNTKSEETMNMAGQGGPDYTIPAEIRPELKHRRGAIAAARMGDGVNPKRESSGSQFYIVHSESGCRALNGQYTVFGQVLSGLDVIDSVASQPRGMRDMPKEHVRMSMEIREMKKSKIEEEYDFVYPRN